MAVHWDWRGAKRVSLGERITNMRRSLARRGLSCTARPGVGAVAPCKLRSG